MDDDLDADIEATLVAEVSQAGSPQELFEAVHQRYPFASRQEIVHAAFRSMIDTAIARDYRRAALLQSFARDVRRQ
jgi:hypothetical protein